MTAGSRERDPKAKALLGPKNSLPHDYKVPQAYRTAIPEELYATSFIGDRAQAWLQDADADAPFFLMVSFPDPHHPFNPPGKYWDMYKPEQFPAPEAFSRNDWTPPPLIRHIIAEREAGKANLAGMNTIGVSAREAQEARALTCGMIACVDDAIGGVLAALDRDGLRDDTVVIFTSDHGDHLGDHRLMLKGAEQYQGIVRVPFIWSDPEASGYPARTQALGSTMDISATILDRAKIEPFSGMQGRSLTPALRRGGGSARQRVHPVRSSAAEPGHGRAAARAHADRRPLPPELVPRHRMGRALRSRRRSRRVREPVGQSGARRERARNDGAAAADRDRARRPRAAADAEGVIVSTRAACDANPLPRAATILGGKSRLLSRGGPSARLLLDVGHELRPGLARYLEPLGHELLPHRRVRMRGLRRPGQASRMAAGVPFFTRSPNQTFAVNSGYPSSAKVGTSSIAPSASDW